MTYAVHPLACVAIKRPIHKVNTDRYGTFRPFHQPITVVEHLQLLCRNLRRDTQACVMRMRSQTVLLLLLL